MVSCSSPSSGTGAMSNGNSQKINTLQKKIVCVMFIKPYMPTLLFVRCGDKSMTTRSFVGALASTGAAIVLLGVISQHQASAQFATPCGVAQGDTAKWINKVANGHGWTEHSQEFRAGTLIAGLAMPPTPKVTTRTEYQSLMLTIVGSSQITASLISGRKAWWWKATGTIVFFDPSSSDCGTAFRPADGRPYFDRQR
jgi:hypothetical protein